MGSLMVDQSASRSLETKARLTSDEADSNEHQVYLPLRSGKIWVPKADNSRQSDRRKGDARAARNP